ncbi:MAG: formimidoylglutamate deiminase [Arenimonas sp.]|uniref:formimidoylglutamate deiminase n=1 Tax=Arenimonas sp. TaxID=1872635 RepID=UPI0025C3654F|nr:formimidoylglutamate deiminase [Arenimonas sp.]MBW8367410.1 formimidoylglutamate deiminase [Arenimonas sp.]
MPNQRADHAFLSTGWAQGHDEAVSPGSDAHVRWRLAGMPNLHSHAFQRAMAGLAERQSHPEDSFWTWRELMYRFAGRITPDSMHAVATQLYVEMLEAGYTSVCEFQYLHHRPDGRPYDDPAHMSLALVAAARDAGIRLTLLPVLYMSGGFDGRALSERQRRFGHSLDAYLSLLQALRAQQDDTLAVGIALHSLRAVPLAAMREVLAAVGGEPLPIHIHIAEQIGEVQDCLALRGARPVEWLLANADVDARWTLVHATHLEAAEVQGIVRSGATVAICPTTEANLGDGLFPLRDYLAAGGQWGIGSDSHVSVSPVEELRWLEYGQRLLTRHRNIAVSASQPSTGEFLYAQALRGGLRACGQGERAAGDFIVLDDRAPALAAAARGDLLDRFVFAGNRGLVKEAHVAGRRVVADGRHHDREPVARRYAQALRQLLED